MILGHPVPYAEIVEPFESKLNTMSPSARSTELVLLIHGTFAGRAEDEGDSWWQAGSPAWEELSKRLPPGARLPEQGEVFHWSGDNSERARIKAGHDLLERTAMETYRGRWLGLWSSNDEAINGLRATLDLSVSFVAQVAPRDRILLSDYLSLLSRPYSWMLAPVFNHLLRPLLDRVVRSFVVKTAQGSNRPSAEVIAVSPFPVPDAAADAHPALPPELNARLVDRANEHARDIAPKLRDLLAEPSFVAGLERFGHALSGQELIHTSYFDHPPVLELLALNVAWGRRDESALRRTSRIQQDLWSWFCEFKRSVQGETNLQSSGRRMLRPALIRPRRRTVQRPCPTDRMRA